MELFMPNRKIIKTSKFQKIAVEVAKKIAVGDYRSAQVSRDVQLLQQHLVCRVRPSAEQ